MSGGPAGPDGLHGAGSPGVVAVCVLRLERRGAGLAITVSVTPDVRSGDGERFVTSSLDEALEAVRVLATGLRDAPG